MHTRHPARPLTRYADKKRDTSAIETAHPRTKNHRRHKEKKWLVVAVNGLFDSQIIHRAATEEDAVAWGEKMKRSHPAHQFEYKIQSPDGTQKS